MQFHRPQQIRLFLDFSVSISCNGKNRFNHYIDSIPHRHSSPISTITKTKKTKQCSRSKLLHTPSPVPLPHCGLYSLHCCTPLPPLFCHSFPQEAPKRPPPPRCPNHTKQSPSYLPIHSLTVLTLCEKHKTRKLKTKNEEKSSKQTKSGEKHWFSTHSCIIADMGMTSDNIKCIQPSDFQGNTYNYYVCYMHRTQKCIYKWVLRMKARACTAYQVHYILIYNTRVVCTQSTLMAARTVHKSISIPHFCPFSLRVYYEMCVRVR